MSDADPVPLTQAPNVIFAESLCGMLRSNGIEAFYKQSGPGSGLSFTGTVQRLNDAVTVHVNGRLST